MKSQGFFCIYFVIGHLKLVRNIFLLQFVVQKISQNSPPKTAYGGFKKGPKTPTTGCDNDGNISTSITCGQMSFGRCLKINHLQLFILYCLQNYPSYSHHVRGVLGGVNFKGLNLFGTNLVYFITLKGELEVPYTK